MKREFCSIALTGSLLLVLPSTDAQDGDSQEPVRCVALSRIDRTEVIDDRTIAFFMRGRDIYINHLDVECPRLDRERRFSYRTSTGQLCSIDTITVIENTGFGIGPGVSCRLGMFVPTTEEALAILKGDEEPAEITVEDIEVEE